jgi:transposase
LSNLTTCEYLEHRRAFPRSAKTGFEIRLSLERYAAFSNTSNPQLQVISRARAILGYIEGRRVVDLAAELDVTRGSVNRWLQWYEAMGVEGLLTGTPPGPSPKLSEAQRDELTAIVEAGPLAAGFQSGVWTGPMVGDLIERRFGVRYHKHNVPRLLHELGFSMQRPRKRLARADAAKQATWLRKTFPTIKKKPARAADS